MSKNKSLNPLKDIVANIFPKNKNELIIFFCLLIFYLSYSLYLGINSNITDDFYHPLDTYFSFDNSSIVHYGGEFGPWHPLLKLFLYPFVFLGNLLIMITSYGKSKTILFIVISAVLISLSIIYIYRYLIEITSLKKSISTLLIIFYATTATNLILSFTIESFSISLFFLSYITYYYASKIKQNKKTDFTTNLILTICVAGTTVTNIMKAFVPIYYIESNKKKAIINISILGIIVSLIILLLNKNIFESVSSHLQFISSCPDFTIVQKIIRFFGSPIIFPDLTIFNFFNECGYIVHKMIDIDYYNSIIPIINLIFILIFTITSLYFNIKNKYIQILILPFIIDIIMHIIIQFGLDFPFIYGAHWIYIIPLALGWGYKLITCSLTKKIIATLFISLTIIEIIINMNQLSEFINLSIHLYQK